MRSYAHGTSAVENEEHRMCKTYFVPENRIGKKGETLQWFQQILELI